MEGDRELEGQKRKAGSNIFIKYLVQATKELDLEEDSIIPPAERLAKKI